MNEAENKLKKLLSDVLKIPEESINDQTAPDNVESWDSFNGLLLAAELEKAFDLSFSVDEIVSTKNVGDIKKNLRNHSIDI